MGGEFCGIVRRRRSVLLSVRLAADLQNALLVSVKHARCCVASSGI